MIWTVSFGILKKSGENRSDQMNLNQKSRRIKHEKNSCLIDQVIIKSKRIHVFPTSVKLQNLIENVQRRASKPVHELNDLSYEERLKKLDMPTLAYRRLRGDMIEVFKMLTNNSGYDQSVTTNLLTREGHNRTRGHALKLKMNKSRTSLRKHFFTQRVVKEWNNLPRGCSVNTTTFKSRLDKCWEKRKFMLRPTQMTLQWGPVTLAVKEVTSIGSCE